MKLTMKETDALRLVYYAMCMRFNDRRPPAPTKEQYLIIREARASLPISKKIWDKLEARKLLVREMGGVLYLTPKGLDQVFPPLAPLNSGGLAGQGSRQSRDFGESK